MQPESEEWKLFVSDPQVSVYAWLDPETGYFQWKVFGEIEYSSKILKHVLLDLDYRKQWDSYVGSIEKIEENNNLEVIYWDVKYGIPFVSNRDYVYCRELKGLCYALYNLYSTRLVTQFYNLDIKDEASEETYSVLLSKTYESETELVAPKKGKVRVVGFKQFVAIVDTPKGFGHFRNQRFRT